MPRSNTKSWLVNPLSITKAADHFQSAALFTMKILKLMHPRLGLCAQEVVHKKNKSSLEIQRVWKARYGQKFNECYILAQVDDVDAPRSIMYIKTGNIYHSVKEASEATFVSESTIRTHLNKQLSKNTHKEYLFKWHEY